MSAEAAFDRAFCEEDETFAAICWSDELAERPDDAPRSFEREGRYVDSRTLSVSCPPEAAFDPVACIGGENGWYAFDTLWDIRGFMDLLLGGPGRRRSSRSVRTDGR